MNYKNYKSGIGRLEEAVRACRQRSRSERLSEAAREKITVALNADVDYQALPSLFTSTRRMLVAGALPLALAGALLVLIDRTGPAPIGASDPAPVVYVSKDGNRVQFTILNGKTNHYISRSASPDRFEQPAVMVDNGAYVERLGGGEELVFYRID